MSKLPKSRTGYSVIPAIKDNKSGFMVWKHRNVFGDFNNVIPVAVIPCNTQREARAIVRLHKDYPDLQQILERVDMVLTMVPARGRDDKYMNLFQDEYVAPLIKRLRGQLSPLNLNPRKP